MKFLHLYKPKNFSSNLEIVLCVCWKDDKFLCLLRNTDKIEGNKWGFPGGKIKKDESLEVAIKREMVEEVGLKLATLVYKGEMYIRYPDLDFIVHMFESKIDKDVALNLETKENQQYEWYTIEKFLKLNLVNGNGEIIKKLYM